MKIKKRITIVGLLTILLLAIIIIVSFGVDYMQSKKALNNFSELIKQGKIGDISLTIYYIKPWMLTPMPYSIDILINRPEDDKIVIYGSDLEEHIDLLNQIGKATLIPIIFRSRVDARFYYVFETEEEGRIFDVAMWGDNYSIYINGFEVKESQVFYDIIIPFLPEDIAEAAQGWAAH